jgi:hypothetical protein
LTDKTDHYNAQQIFGELIVYVDNLMKADGGHDLAQPCKLAKSLVLRYHSMNVNFFFTSFLAFPSLHIPEVCLSPRPQVTYTILSTAEVYIPHCFHVPSVSARSTPTLHDLSLKSNNTLSPPLPILQHLGVKSLPQDACQLLASPLTLPSPSRVPTLFPSCHCSLAQIENSASTYVLCLPKLPRILEHSKNIKMNKI